MNVIWSLLFGCIVAYSLLVFLKMFSRNRPTVLRVKSASEDEYDFTAVKTKGDRSYIPLNLYNYDGDPYENAEKILSVLSAFGNTRSVEIKSWKIEKQGFRVLGIWVDHRPRDF